VSEFETKAGVNKSVIQSVTKKKKMMVVMVVVLRTTALMMMMMMITTMVRWCDGAADNEDRMYAIRSTLEREQIDSAAHRTNNAKVRSTPTTTATTATAAAADDVNNVAAASQERERVREHQQ
jgi:hypothetical protein